MPGFYHGAGRGCVSGDTVAPKASRMRRGQEAVQDGSIVHRAENASLVFGCSDFAHGLSVISQARMFLPVSKAGCVAHAKAILFCIAKGLWQAYAVAGNSQ